MNEKFNELYSYLKDNGMTDLDANSFHKKYSDPSKSKEIHSYLKSSNMTDLDESSFHSTYFGVKKKEPSESQSEQPLSDIVEKHQVPGSLGLSQTVEQNVRDLTPKDKGDGIYKYKSRPDATYKKENGEWFIDPKSSGEFVPIVEDKEKRVAVLEKASTIVDQSPYDYDLGKRFEKSKKELGIEPVKEMSFDEKAQVDLNLLKLRQITYDKVVFKKDYNKAEVISMQKKLKEAGHNINTDGDIYNPLTQKAIDPEYISKTAYGKKKAEVDRLKASIEDPALDAVAKLPEEVAVPLLRKQLSKFGFSFEETGMGNTVKITSHLKTSPDSYLGSIASNTIEIDLGAEDSGAKIREFMNKSFVTNVESQFINKQIKPGEGEYDNAKAKLVELVSSDPAKYGEVLLTEVDASKVLDTEYKNLNKASDELVKEYAQLKANAPKNPTKEQEIAFNNKIHELTVREYQLNEEYKKMGKVEEGYTKAVGAYASKKEKEGNVLGGVTGLMAKGFASIGTLSTDVGIDVMIDALPEEWVKQAGDDRTLDKASKDIKREVMPSLEEAYMRLGSLGSTTKEWTQSEDRSDLTKAVLFLSESTGAALAGGGSGKLANTAFFAMSYNGMQNEMRGEEFDELTEGEKMLISAPYGIVVGALEKMGFTGTISGSKNPITQKLVNNTLSRAITGLPKDATKETLQRAIDKSLALTMSEMGVKIVSGSISEGATEGAQSIAGASIKNIVNAVKEKELFDVPDLTTMEGWKEALKDASVDAYYGALGGAVMSTGSSVKAVASGQMEKSREQKAFTLINEVVSDPVLLSAAQDGVKLKYKNKEITKEEATQELENLKEATSVIGQIPTDLDTADKLSSFKLLNEKSALEKKVVGKDKALVDKELNRINAIEVELKAISNGIKKAEVVQETIEESNVGATETIEVAETSPPSSQITVDNSVDFIEKASKSGNIETVQAASKIVKSIPDVKVFLHENSETYANAVSQSTGIDIDTILKEEVNDPTSGQYSNGEIHIDLSKANQRTVYHEAFHHVLSQKGITRDNAVQMVNDIKAVSTNKETLERAQQFADNYNPEENPEEFMSELVGILSSEASQLDSSGLQKLVDIINKYSQKLLGVDIFKEGASRKEVLDFINSMSKNLREGRVVTSSSVAKEGGPKKQKSLKTKEAILSEYKELVESGAINESMSLEEMQSIVKIAEKDSKSTTVQRKINKTTGVTKTNKEVVVKDEMVALRQQIRAEAKVALDVYQKTRQEGKQELKAQKDGLKSLSSAISDMVKKGKITNKQASSIIKKMTNLNLSNEQAVENFLSYTEKVFNDAEYDTKLKQAFDTRAKIKRLLKSDNEIHNTTVARDFAKINPSYASDLDAYNEIATILSNAMRPSRIDGLEVQFREATDIKKVQEYTKEQLEVQEKLQKDRLLEMYKELVDVGVINGDMSLKEIQELVASIDDNDPKMAPDKKEKHIKAYIENAFKMQSILLEDILKTKKDPFNGEDFDFSESQKDIMTRLLALDPSELSIKEGIRMVEAVNNFMVNQNTGGVEAMVNLYEGISNAKKDASRGVKAKTLSSVERNIKRKSPTNTNKAWLKNIANLPEVFNNAFRGVTSGTDIMNSIGITSVMKGVAKAKGIHTDFVNSYFKKYKNAKPNGKAFMDVSNIYERGMYAYLRRTVAGSIKEQHAEFVRRVGLLKDSLAVLQNSGDIDLMRKGKHYQDVFDKMGLNDAGLTISDVDSRIDPKNKEAVVDMTREWSIHYPELANVSESVYNTILGSDLNYTPDKHSLISVVSKAIESSIDDKTGAFALEMGLDANKAGVLMEVNRTSGLSKDRYIDLDFDVNNSRSMASALTDIYTAAPIRKVKGYMTSPYFDQIVPNSKDRTFIKERVYTTINRAKMKKALTNDELQAVNQVLQLVGKIGADRALGSLAQPFKQMIPVIFNTFINSGRMPSFGDVMNSDYNKFLKNNGIPVSLRGLESISNMDKIDSQFDKSVAVGPKKILGAINKFSDMKMKLLLSMPDVAVAKASWAAYYKQSLKEQGLSTNIDWATHKENEKASNYATAQVDRQQNVSDQSMAGDFMAGDSTTLAKTVRNVVMPFASFQMNQKTRMFNDFMVLSSGKQASKEDKAKATRSLMGLFTEMLVFHGIGFTVRYMILQQIAYAITGEEPDEEEIQRILKGQKAYALESVFKDIISPSPIADKYVVDGANMLIEFSGLWKDHKGAQKALEKENKAREEKGNDPLEGKDAEKFKTKFITENEFQFPNYDSGAFGMFSIGTQKIMELNEFYDLAYNRKFEKEDGRGNVTEKYITKKDAEPLKDLFPALIAYNVGLFPAEVASVARYASNQVKKKGMTDNQYEKMQTVEKEAGRPLKNYEMFMVQSTRKVDAIQSEMDYIDAQGGLTEEQGKEWIKFVEKKGYTPNRKELSAIKGI